MIRQIEWNKKICDLFGNVPGIELIIYCGEGNTEETQKHCEKYHNIVFIGRYTVDQIPSFVEQTDVLLNLYENDEQQKLAMTVKLYDGIRYGLLDADIKDLIWRELMQTNDFVYVTDVDEFDIEAFKSWYQSLNKEYSSIFNEYL